MRRALQIFLPALAALVALALPGVAAAKVPADFYGISAVDPTDHDYAQIAKTGFGVSRFEISWRVVQQTRHGGYDWTYVDDRVRQIAKAGLQPAPIVYGTPRFIRESPDGFYPPTESAEDRTAWQELLAEATARYGPGGAFWDENPGVPSSPVRQWIIWNEENARPFWRPKASPRDYATLVKISDQAISPIDPMAKIVLGGIYGYPKDQRSMSAVHFLQGFYRVKKIQHHFDSISLHPYGSGVASVRKQILQARSVARKAGDAGVGILIGELGWASNGPSKSESVVGARGQATRLRHGLKLLVDKRDAWNIVGVYIYVWRDFSLASPCLWCPGAGLVEADGTGKPALSAVRSVISATR